MTSKEILEKFCRAYENSLNGLLKDEKRHTCEFVAATYPTETNKNLIEARVYIKIDTLPIYHQRYLSENSESAIEKACERILSNLLFYGLSAAEKDLKDALKGEKPFVFSVNFE